MSRPRCPVTAEASCHDQSVLSRPKCPVVAGGAVSRPVCPGTTKVSCHCRGVLSRRVSCHVAAGGVLSRPGALRRCRGCPVMTKMSCHKQRSCHDRGVLSQAVALWQTVPVARGYLVTDGSPGTNGFPVTKTVLSQKLSCHERRSPRERPREHEIGDLTHSTLDFVHQLLNKTQEALAS